MDTRSVRRRRGAAIVIGGLLGSSLVGVVHADPGDPVTSFSGDGVAVIREGTPPTSELAGDAVAMPDGSVVVVGTVVDAQVGSVGLAKVKGDRTIDRSFGTNGRVHVERTGRSLVATSIARHDGGFVVAGFTSRVVPGADSDAFVMRFTGTGRIDRSFGANGLRIVRRGGNQQVNDIAVDSGSDRIALSSETDDGTLVTVFDADGALAADFGASGNLPLTGGATEPHVEFQADGSLIVVDGYAGVSRDIRVTKLASNGALDASFGLFGVRVVDIAGSDDEPAGLQLRGSRIVVAAGSGDEAALVVVTTNGVPDATFSGDGVVVLPGSAANVSPVDLAVGGSGAIRVLSRASTGFFGNWQVTETSAAGVHNAAFAGTGFALLPSNDFLGFPAAVLWRGDLTTVVGGRGQDFAVADLLPSGAFGSVRQVNVGRRTSMSGSTDVTMRADGGILIAGAVYDDLDRISGLVVALRPDGSRDRTFGRQGAARVRQNGGDAVGLDVVARRRGGSVLLVGRRTDAGMGYDVVGLREDGSRQPSFGTDGRVVLPGLNDVEAASLGVATIDRNGRVVVAVAQSVAGARSTAVVRIRTNGTLDSSFGTNGVVTVPTLDVVEPLDIEVLPNGRVIVAESNRIIGLTRSGALIPDFGEDSFGFAVDGVIPGPGGLTSASAADVTPDGKVVLTESATNAVTMVRIGADGTLDPSFGGGAPVPIPTGELISVGARDVTVQPDGKVLVIESGIGPDDTDEVTMWRYTATGTLDSGFGTGGAQVVDLPGLESSLHEATVALDGDIVAVGPGNLPELVSLVARLDGGAAARCAGRFGTIHLAIGERPTSGDDVIIGTGAGDVIEAGGGDDVVCGLGGGDTLRGEGGRDLLIGGNGPDALDGDVGVDECRGGAGADTAVRCEEIQGVP